MDLLLFGGGGHCKAVIDVIEAAGTWNIAGIVEKSESSTSDVLGYPVVGFDNQMADLLRLCKAALVTVGHIRSPDVRKRIFQSLQNAGFILPTIISPLARVARSARIGPGTVIMHYVQIGPDAVLGCNNIINSRSLVEHDVNIGDHCHIATSAVLNGNVVVGEGSFVGSGSVCREGIRIGNNCLIGMGANVRKSIADGGVLYGCKSQ